MESILCTGFILVGVVIWICRSWEDKRKRDARQEWAQSRGLHYFRSDERLAATTSQVFSLGPLFPYVKRYVARDVVALRTPFGEALYYELTWRSGSGGENSSYTYSNAILRYPLPGALPRIRIKGRGMNVIFPSLEELVYGGGRGREFAIATEWQAFNEEFDVKSVNGQAARALLTPSMQEFLMDYMRKGHMEIVGDVAYLAFEAYNVNDSFGCVELMREWTAQVPPSLFGGAWTY